MIDGAVARAQRNSRASGALLDSVIDRYSEGFLLLGALIYFYNLESLLGIVLAFSAWFGSILVSYVRARAEGLQVTCKVGLYATTRTHYLTRCWNCTTRRTLTQTSNPPKYRHDSSLYTRYTRTHLTHYRYPPSHLFISRIESLTPTHAQPNETNGKTQNSDNQHHSNPFIAFFDCPMASKPCAGSIPYRQRYT